MNQIDLAKALGSKKAIGGLLLLVVLTVFVAILVATREVDGIYQDAEARETNQLKSRGCAQGRRENATVQFDWLSWSCADGATVRQLVHKPKTTGAN